MRAQEKNAKEGRPSNAGRADFPRIPSLDAQHEMACQGQGRFKRCCQTESRGKSLLYGLCFDGFMIIARLCRVPFGVIAFGIQSGGFGKIEVGNEEVFFAVGNVSHVIARRIDEAGGGVLMAHGLVHAGKVDGVFGGAALHGFFIEGDAPFLGFTRGFVATGDLGLKNDLSTAQNRPSRGFGIAPPFVANDNAKLDAVDGEDFALSVWNIIFLFAARCDLVFGLMSEQSPGG